MNLVNKSTFSSKTFQLKDQSHTHTQTVPIYIKLNEGFNQIIIHFFPFIHLWHIIHIMSNCHHRSLRLPHASQKLTEWLMSNCHHRSLRLPHASQKLTEWLLFFWNSNFQNNNQRDTTKAIQYTQAIQHNGEDKLNFGCQTKCVWHISSNGLVEAMYRHVASSNGTWCLNLSSSSNVHNAWTSCPHHPMVHDAWTCPHHPMVHDAWTSCPHHPMYTMLELLVLIIQWYVMFELVLIIQWYMMLELLVLIIKWYMMLELLVLIIQWYVMFELVLIIQWYMMLELLVLIIQWYVMFELLVLIIQWYMMLELLVLIIQWYVMFELLVLIIQWYMMLELSVLIIQWYMMLELSVFIIQFHTVGNMQEYLTNPTCACCTH